LKNFEAISLELQTDQKVTRRKAKFFIKGLYQ